MMDKDIMWLSISESISEDKHSIKKEKQSKIIFKSLELTLLLTLFLK